jgi:hypothetical protein
MQNIRVLTVLAFVVLAFFASEVSAVEATDEGCLFVAYTYDGAGHYSLVKTNSSLVGQALTVVTDCPDEFVIFVNDQPRFGGVGLVAFDLPMNTHSVEITTDNYSIKYDNLTLFPAADWGEFIHSDIGLKDPVTLSASDLEMSKAWTVIMSSMILWFIVTMIAWKAVNYWVDKFHIEEVI